MSWKPCFIAFLSITACFFLSAADTPITIERNTAEYTIHYILPEYQLVPVSRTGEKISGDVDGETFLLLSCPDHGEIMDEGQANLPYYRIHWALGKNAVMPKVTICNIKRETVTLTSKIFPVQKRISRSEGTGQNRFSMDYAYYSSQGLRPSPVKIHDPFIIRGVHGAKIDIQPFTYNPQLNTLEIITRCDIVIDASHEKPVVLSSPAFYSFARAIFSNAPQLIQQGATRTKENYVILAESSMNAALSDFISFREEDYTVSTIDAATLGGNQSIIIDKIKELYTNPDTRPTYLLLVGGFPLVPMCQATSSSSLGTPQNDLWYGAVDGSDYYPDIFVGRFSFGAGETNGVSNLARKAIYMQKNMDVVPRKNIYIAAGGPYAENAEGPMNYIMDTYFGPALFTNLKLYEGDGDISTQQVSSPVNDGLCFIFYSGHGNWDHWKTGNFFNDNVSALSNSMYPMVFSFACLTGDFNALQGPCFAETWTNTSKGAVTFLGASTESTWDPDDILERRIIDGMFREKLTCVQPAIAYGKIQVDKELPKWGKFYAETYNLCGDPSLDARVALPTPIKHSHKQKSAYSPVQTVSVKNFGTYQIISLDMPISDVKEAGFSVYTPAGKKVLAITAPQPLFRWNCKTRDGTESAKGIYCGVIRIERNGGGTIRLNIKLTRF